MSGSRTWYSTVVTLVLAASPLATTVAGTYVDDVDATAASLDHAQLRGWLADGERGLWIQALDLRWFYARFSHACHGLPATNSLSFDSQGSHSIDSRTAVVVPGSGRCTVLSFLPSRGPPDSRNADVLPQPQAQ